MNNFNEMIDIKFNKYRSNMGSFSSKLQPTTYNSEQCKELLNYYESNYSNKSQRAINGFQCMLDVTELIDDILETKENLSDHWQKLSPLYEKIINNLHNDRRNVHTYGTHWHYYDTCTTWIDMRYTFVNTFSWSAIPKRVYKKIGNYLKGVNVTKVIDPLCGTGFNSFMLLQEGLDVEASDIVLRDIQWVPVRQIDAKELVINDVEHTALLLSWIGWSESIGTEMIYMYKGDYIVMIGEEEGGCCANMTFFNELDNNWNLVQEFAIPQFWGIHDGVFIYERKNKFIKVDR